jgi:hypothetical protein
MRSLMSDALERIQVLQAELQQIDQQRQRVSERLEAMRVLYEWERDRDSRDSNTAIVQPVLRDLAEQLMSSAGDNNYALAASTARWAGVPVQKAVQQVIEEHPEWLTMERSPLIHRILDLLMDSGYVFQSKLPFNSVNISLNKVLAKKKKEEEAKGAKGAKGEKED